MSVASTKIKLSLFFNKYFIFITVVMVAVVVAAGYFLFIKNVVQNIRNVGSTSLDGRKSVLATKQLTLNQLRQLEKNYAPITDIQMRQLRDFLPQEEEIPFLLIEIKQLLESHDLTVVSLDSGTLGGEGTASQSETAVSGDASTPSASASIQPLNVSVVISGITSYTKMKDFLDTMSTELPLLELNSLTYSPVVDTYTLNLTTYYR